MSKRTVLVATSTFPLFDGDVRTPFVSNLAADMILEGWNVVVSAPHAPGARMSDNHGDVPVERFRYAPDRLEILAYGSGGLINLRSAKTRALAPLFVAAQALALRNLARRHQADLVHAHWLLPQGFTSLSTGRPIVATVHGGDVFGLRSPVFRPFKRAAIAGASAITVNGPATRNAAIALGASPDRLRTIHMPPADESAPDQTAIDAIRADLPEGAFLLLFAGRLVPEKGPDDFIRAVAATGDDRIHGLIAGDGPMRQDLMALAAELGVAGRIRFAGWQKPAELTQMMHAADAFLGPSKEAKDGWVEAQGIVFLEAMRAGIHTLAPRIGGIPGIVRHLETGWLFSPGNVTSMAALISAAARKHLDSSAEIRASGQAFAKTINRRATARAFSDLFHGVVDNVRR